MICKDALVQMFLGLDEKVQRDVWYKFVGDTKDKRIEFYADAIYTQKDFWEMSEEIYWDGKEDGEELEPWGQEVARRVLLSPNYNPNDKYIRDSWDEEAKVCRMISGNNPLDLIRKVDGRPLYELDSFAEWFEKFVISRLNKYEWHLLEDD